MLKKPKKLRRFLSYYKPYRLLFTIDLLCALIVSATALLIPLIIRYVTNDLLPQGGDYMTKGILRVGLGLLLLLLVRTVCMYVYDAKGHGMGAMMERDMRKELFDHLMQQPFSFYDGNKPGELLTRMTTDLNNLSELCHHGPENLVLYLIQIIGSASILMTVNARMTLIILAFIPFMVFYTLFFNKRLQKSYRKNLDMISRVNSYVEEVLSNIRIVKSSGNESHEKQRFSSHNDEFTASRKDIYKNESVLYTGMDFLSHMIKAALIVFGAVFISGETMQVEDLITFFLYADYLISPIPQMAWMTQQYQEGITAFNRFTELLDIEPVIQDCEAPAVLTPIHEAIIFNKVTFRYGTTAEPVLTDINLTIPAGSYLALVGSSGVGKTTFCSLIPRFYDVSQGGIHIDGRDIREYSVASLRQEIGMVHQDTFLFSGSIYDNILYGRTDAAEDEVITAAKQANAHTFITQLPDGYQTEIGHRGMKLSGGQKQRIGIARAFLKNPSLLILDEATSSLDSESEQLVQSAMEMLAKSRTTIAIAHRLSTIRNADYILVLDEGGICEAGSHQELMEKKGRYAAMWSAQLN